MVFAAREQAQVAQLVEQRIENPRVGGSNPPLGTTVFKHLHVYGYLFPRGDDADAMTAVERSLVGQKLRTV